MMVIWLYRHWVILSQFQSPKLENTDFLCLYSRFFNTLKILGIKSYKIRFTHPRNGHSHKSNPFTGVEKRNNWKEYFLFAASSTVARAYIIGHRHPFISIHGDHFSSSSQCRFPNRSAVRPIDIWRPNFKGKRKKVKGCARIASRRVIRLSKIVWKQNSWNKR